MNQSIYMRLSNGIDHSIDFTANNEASFTTECRSAWRRYRAEFATPEYFAAQQQLNELRHLLEPDLNGSNKAIKISEWIGRGHSPEKAESLWSGLLDNRRIQLANAKLRLKAHMMPDYLEIHVSSISSPGKHWFNPAMGVCGVRIYADMRIEARTHAGLKKWSWGSYGALFATSMIMSGNCSGWATGSASKLPNTLSKRRPV